MAAIHTISVYSELANFIASCQESMLVELHRDPRTDAYKFSRASDSKIASMYQNENEFFEEMHSFLDELTSRKRFYVKNVTYDDFGVSPWILEKIHRERGKKPPRNNLANIEHVHLEYMCAAGYVRCGVATSDTNVPNVPFAFISVSLTEFERYKEAFHALFGRHADCVVMVFPYHHVDSKVIE